MVCGSFCQKEQASHVRHLEALSLVADSCCLVSVSSLCVVEIFWVFSKGEVLFYAGRNLVFVVQQRNLRCSISRKLLVKCCLTSFIQERSAAAILRKVYTKMEESKKAGLWVCTEERRKLSFWLKFLAGWVVKDIFINHRFFSPLED